MSNVHSTEQLGWLAGYTKLLGSAQDGLDRRQYLKDLVKVVLSASGARRVHALLMERDTVAAEAVADTSGSALQADEEARKAMARQAMAEIRGQENGADQGCNLKDDQGRTLLSAPLTRGAALVLSLEGLPENGSGLPLAISKTLAAAHLLMASEARQQAEHQARTADARVVEIESAVGGGGVGAVAYLKPVAELERDAIELALRTTKWNKEESARRLGISRASIYMKVKKFGLQKPI